MQFSRNIIAAGIMLALAGGALAQSNVTVYGTVDVGVAHMSSSGI